jgi:hypothetical protein
MRLVLASVGVAVLFVAAACGNGATTVTVIDGGLCPGAMPNSGASCLAVGSCTWGNPPGVYPTGCSCDCTRGSDGGLAWSCEACF